MGGVPRNHAPYIGAMCLDGVSKIHRQPLLLTVAIADGFGAVAASEFFRQGGCSEGLFAAGLGFGKGALGCRGEVGAGKIGPSLVFIVHAGFLVRTLRVI